MVRRRDREIKKTYGWFRFKNSHQSADMLLSKPTRRGQTLIPANGTFEGDSYYIDHPGCYIDEDLTEIKYPVEKTNENNEINESNKEKVELLTDTPPGENILETFINKEENIENKNNKKLEMSRKELEEFAAFKGIKTSSGWNKEKIMEKIREKI